MTHKDKLQALKDVKESVEGVFFDECHTAATNGDNMKYMTPDGGHRCLLSEGDKRIVWNTYVWHYYKAMERLRNE